MILLTVQVYGKVRETHGTFDKLRVIGKCHLYIEVYVHNILTFILSAPTLSIWTPIDRCMVKLEKHMRPLINCEELENVIYI